MNWLADVQMQCHQLGKVLVVVCFLGSQALVPLHDTQAGRFYAPCQHMMSIVKTQNFPGAEYVDQIYHAGHY